MVLKKSEDEVQQELLVALGRVILSTVSDVPAAHASNAKPRASSAQAVLSPDEVVSSLREAAARCGRLSRKAAPTDKHDLEEVGLGLAALASDLERKYRIPGG